MKSNGIADIVGPLDWFHNTTVKMPTMNAEIAISRFNGDFSAMPTNVKKDKVINIVPNGRAFPENIVRRP